MHSLLLRELKSRANAVLGVGDKEDKEKLENGTSVSKEISESEDGTSTSNSKEEPEG